MDPRRGQDLRRPDEPFLPRLIGFDDDGRRPMLILEDLSTHHRPPPWTPGAVDAVLASMQLSWATDPPAGLRTADVGILRSWDHVAAHPETVVSSGRLAERRLDDWLPNMQMAAAEATPTGTSFVHHDVRSDNLAIGPDGVARFFDWNWAAVGNPQLDLAGWLPSPAMEGGPRPWEVMADGGAYAAAPAGCFVWSASQPLLPDVAPHIRAFQRAQGEVALEWVCRELDVPLR